MKQRHQLLLLLTGMLISLLALVAMQWYWLREVQDSRQAQFDQSVAESLRQVNYSLEALEASRLINKVLHQEQWVKQVDSIAGTTVLLSKRSETAPKQKRNLLSDGAKTFVVIRDSVQAFDVSTGLTKLGKPLSIPPAIAAGDMPLVAADSLIVRSFSSTSSDLLYTFRYEAKTDSILKELLAGDSLLKKQLRMQPAQRVIIRADFNENAEKSSVAGKNKLPVARKENTDKTIEQRPVPVDSLLARVTRDFIAPKQPIEKRISAAQFDSLLKVHLEQSGIYLPFRYWVSRDEAGASTFIFGDKGVPPSGTHFYQTRLFPNDLFHQNEQLLLYFLDESAHLQQGITGLYVLSGLLLLLVAGIFYAAFRYLMHHKRLSEVKSDFINNMSHEFKTPLATINLATDALANDKVKSQPNQIDKYLGIIKSENRRMNQHVELVLQTARLERKELKLQRHNIELKALLEQAVELMQMQFEEKQGHITLESVQAVELFADENHLLNVFTNLLDNALKYCKAEPKVSIGMELTGNKVELHFTDNGIGMSKEHIDHIFDQFYRVPTGNLHNVKGFGLGLSYAKAIVEAHGGRLWVQSQPGAGSTFSIQLPLNPTHHA